MVALLPGASRLLKRLQFMVFQLHETRCWAKWGQAGYDCVSKGCCAFSGNSLQKRMT